MGKKIPINVERDELLLRKYRKGGKVGFQEIRSYANLEPHSKDGKAEPPINFTMAEEGDVVVSAKLAGQNPGPGKRWKAGYTSLGPVSQRGIETEMIKQPAEFKADLGGVLRNTAGMLLETSPIGQIWADDVYDESDSSYKGFNQVGQTVKPIFQTAATAAATAYGGPMAGAGVNALYQTGDQIRANRNAPSEEELAQRAVVSGIQPRYARRGGQMYGNGGSVRDNTMTATPYVPDTLHLDRFTPVGHRMIWDKAQRDQNRSVADTSRTFHLGTGGHYDVLREVYETDTYKDRDYIHDFDTGQEIPQHNPRYIPLHKNGGRVRKYTRGGLTAHNPFDPFDPNFSVNNTAANFFANDPNPVGPEVNRIPTMTPSPEYTHLAGGDIAPSGASGTEGGRFFPGSSPWLSVGSAAANVIPDIIGLSQLGRAEQLSPNLIPHRRVNFDETRRQFSRDRGLMNQAIRKGSSSGRLAYGRMADTSMRYQRGLSQIAEQEANINARMGLRTDALNQAERARVDQFNAQSRAARRNARRQYIENIGGDVSKSILEYDTRRNEHATAALMASIYGTEDRFNKAMDKYYGTRGTFSPKREKREKRRKWQNRVPKEFRYT